MDSIWFARNQVQFENVFNESDLVDIIKRKVGDWINATKSTSVFKLEEE